MPGLQLLDVALDLDRSARLGKPQSVEQQIGNLRHRRNGDDYRPLPLLACTQLCSNANPLGGPHARSAELHGQQVRQCKYSFPFVVLSRTTFRTACSTSSTERLPESMYIASGACISGDSGRVRS